MKTIKSDVKSVKKAGDSLILRLTSFFDSMDLKLDDKVFIRLEKNNRLIIEKYLSKELTKNEVGNIAKLKDYIDTLNIPKNDKDELYSKLNLFFGGCI